jgi:nucleotide-binding universal stress UspA family protein
MAMTEETSATAPKPVRVFLVVVDNTAEMRVALRFACRRARHTSGRVALLHVVEPNEFRNFMGVGDLMREEARTEAEILMQKHAAIVQELSGNVPIVYLREGNRRDELLKLIGEEPSISILVLGASTETHGPGPLISALTGKFLSKLSVPLTIVPGNLDDESVDAIS